LCRTPGYDRQYLHIRPIVRDTGHFRSEPKRSALDTAGCNAYGPSVHPLLLRFIRHRLPWLGCRGLPMGAAPRWQPWADSKCRHHEEADHGCAEFVCHGLLAFGNGKTLNVVEQLDRVGKLASSSSSEVP